MKKLCILVTLGLCCLAVNSGQAGDGPVAFAVATARFEQNATDGDAEVVFEVKGGDAGLLSLRVISPDGRTVVDFNAPDASTSGIRQFIMETPEPEDVAGLKAAYPAGAYLFSARDAAGVDYESKAVLSHKLPDPSALLSPGEEEELGVTQATLTWSPVTETAIYIVAIEQEETEISLTARLPATMTTFSIPEHFLLPGTEYKVAIGVVAENGNTTFAETILQTEGQD